MVSDCNTISTITGDKLKHATIMQENRSFVCYDNIYKLNITSLQTDLGNSQQTSGSYNWFLYWDWPQAHESLKAHQ